MRFAPGDAVRTMRADPPHHSRLPRYARGAVGPWSSRRGCTRWPTSWPRGCRPRPSPSTRCASRPASCSARRAQCDGGRVGVPAGARADVPGRHPGTLSTTTTAPSRARSAASRRCWSARAWSTRSSSTGRSSPSWPGPPRPAAARSSPAPGPTPASGSVCWRTRTRRCPRSACRWAAGCRSSGSRSWRTPRGGPPRRRLHALLLLPDRPARALPHLVQVRGLPVPRRP